MTDREIMNKVIDELIESARLLGGTQAKRWFGVYTQPDAIMEKSLWDGVGVRAKAIRDEVAALKAERNALLKDAERLNFLDRNHQWKMGWVVGIAPLGNLSVTSVIQLSAKPTPIRKAIDAAIAKAEGRKE